LYFLNENPGLLVVIGFRFVDGMLFGQVG